jgi:hypothetical protein
MPIEKSNQIFWRKWIIEPWIKFIRGPILILSYSWKQILSFGSGSNTSSKINTSILFENCQSIVSVPKTQNHWFSHAQIDA